MWPMFTEDIQSILHCSDKYVRWVRDNGLLEMWKVGGRYATNYDCFMEYLKLTKGADLANEGDIITFAIRHKLKRKKKKKRQ